MSHGAIKKIKVAPFYLGHGVYLTTRANIMQVLSTVTQLQYSNC